MSARFAELLPRRAAAGLALAALTALAGCGSSSSTPPAERPGIVLETAGDAPDAGNGEGPARAAAGPLAAEDDGVSRRERRRSRRREAQAAEPEVVDVLAEVPEGAAQGFARAVAAMQSENWIEAELELEQLLLEFDGLTGAYVNLAIVYARDGRTEDAAAALDRALEIDPGHPAANDERGILFRQAGDFAAAESAYRRALESDPGYALAHRNLGILLDLYLGRHEEALEQYEAYQSLLPEPDPEVGRWIVDLRRRLGVTEPPERVAREGGE